MIRHKPASSPPRRRFLARLGPLGLWGLLGPAPFALPGCSGGVGEEGTGKAPPQDTVSVGVVTGLDESAIEVNGVSYALEAAQHADGFDDPSTADTLRLGMWVQVDGSVDPDTGRHIARRVRRRLAVRGTITAVDAANQRFTVLDNAVQWLDRTLVTGVLGADRLAAGDRVEVHGLLGSGAADIIATRIEKDPQPAGPLELRGRVDQLDTAARTFFLGGRKVAYGSATVTLRSSLVDGLAVRVAAAAPPDAADPTAAWAVERLATDQPLPDNLAFFYAEGTVSDWAAGPLFRLEALPVDARSADGRAQVQTDGQRVAAVGALVGGTLVARVVTVVQPGEPATFVVSGLVSDVASLADFRVRSVPVDASTATFTPDTLRDRLLAATAADRLRVRVRGTVQGRRLQATSVVALN